MKNFNSRLKITLVIFGALCLGQLANAAGGFSCHGYSTLPTNGVYDEIRIFGQTSEGGAVIIQGIQSVKHNGTQITRLGLGPDFSQKFDGAITLRPLKRILLVKTDTGTERNLVYPVPDVLQNALFRAGLFLSPSTRNHMYVFLQGGAMSLAFNYLERREKYVGQPAQSYFNCQLRKD